MRRLLAPAAAALVLAASAAAATPYPPRPAGSGEEPTAGSGTGAGLTFEPRFALATYDGSDYVLYLTRTKLSCAQTLLAAPPYLTVTIVTGAPLVVGAPSVNRGDTAFVQVDFFVSVTHYYSIQPKVRLVLTRVAAGRRALWHGRLTVPETRVEGKRFTFDGTFAAEWCGRV